MRPKEKPRKPAAPEPAPPPEEERSYYGAAERAGLRFFDAPPEAESPQTEREGNNEH